MGTAGPPMLASLTMCEAAAEAAAVPAPRAPRSRRAPRSVALLTALLGCLLYASLGAAQGEASVPESRVLVDRLMAWVDEDPIFLSDVRRALDLGLVRTDDGENGSAEDRALDRLVDQRLRLHDVERYESTPIPTSTVDRQIADFEERFGGAAGFDRLLAEHGIGRDEMRGLVRRQLRILAYVEERLGARIFVDEETLLEHYSGPLAEELADRGEPLPPFAEVREAIHELLWQQALNREVERWTDDLRRSARIIDLRDQQLDDPADWPGLLRRLDAPPSMPAKSMPAKSTTAEGSHE